VCRRLVDLGAHVAPVLTEGALRFVGEATFSGLGSERVHTSLFEDADPIPHTRLGQRADLVLVAPATARVIGSYAAGISADLLVATLLATRAPVLVCPAMHAEMWEHPAVQSNLELLRRRGVHVLEPTKGRLAGGDIGAGRLAEPADIVAEAARIVSQARRSGCHGPQRPPRPLMSPAPTLPGAACSSPPAARVSRSTRSASSPTGRPASRATPSWKPQGLAGPRSRS
jgi:phosphopantothenoylcysteine decarboxylase/phosphopantothenate--cysteine ligase